MGKNRNGLERYDWYIQDLKERGTNIFDVYLLIDHVKTLELTQHGHNKLSIFVTMAKILLTEETNLIMTYVQK